MKLKLDENGHAVLENGNPVYIRDDGTESAIDVAGMAKTISARNQEAKTNRERAEKAEATLKSFEGIEDAAAARKALETLASLDQKKLIDAGQVETLKNELNKAWQEKLNTAETRANTLEKQLVDEKIGGSFSRSPFISTKLAVPPDMVEAVFRSHFKLEDGKVVAYDKAGNRLHSRSNPGEFASFDEALGILVESYPHKDAILKPDQKPGGGTPNSAGNAGAKTMTRAQLDSLPAAERMEKMKAGITLTD